MDGGKLTGDEFNFFINKRGCNTQISVAPLFLQGDFDRYIDNEADLEYVR